MKIHVIPMCLDPMFQHLLVMVVNKLVSLQNQVSDLHCRLVQVGCHIHHVAAASRIR